MILKIKLMKVGEKVPEQTLNVLVSGGSKQSLSMELFGLNGYLLVIAADRQVENKISYCATHDTYPRDGEPCWQCANVFIENAVKKAKGK